MDAEEVKEGDTVLVKIDNKQCASITMPGGLVVTKQFPPDWTADQILVWLSEFIRENTGHIVAAISKGIQ